MEILRPVAWLSGLLVLAMAVVASDSLAARAEGGASGRSGFLVSLEAGAGDDGRHEVRWIARTLGGRSARRGERASASDWTVRWLDANGDELQIETVADPLRPLLGSHDPTQPIAFRMSDHPSALLAEVRDAHGTLRAEIPLDRRARDAAEGRRSAAAARLAASSRRGAAKRSADPPQSAAEARRAQERQADAQARLRSARAASCAQDRRERHAPEWIAASDPCRDPYGIHRDPLRASTTPASGMPSVPSAPSRRRALVRQSAVADARIAAEVSLSGRLVFPAGEPAPSGPVTIFAYNVTGAGDVASLTAAPPEFAFSTMVEAGSAVELEILPPVPFVARYMLLGAIDADTHRDVTMERGLVVSARLAFQGAERPSGHYEVVSVDVLPEPISLQLIASPPDYAFAFAVRSGSTATVRYAPDPPFSPVEETWGPITTDTARDIVVRSGVKVSGRVLAPVGESLPAVGFWLNLFGEVDGIERGGSAYVAPPDFEYEIFVPQLAAARLTWDPPAPFLADELSIVDLVSDRQLDVELRRGVVLSVNPRFPAGSTPPTESVEIRMWGINEEGWGISRLIFGPDFRFSYVLEPGMKPYGDLSPPSPFLPARFDTGPLHADTTLTPLLSRGIALTGHVSGPAQYWVHVLDGAPGGWLSEFLFDSPTFRIGMPVRNGSVEVSAEGFLPSEPYRPQGVEDAQHDFVLHPLASLATLSLELRDGDGHALAAARAEAWQDGRFVRSGLSDADGRAELPLVPGTYEIRVWPDTESANWTATSDSSLLYADPAVTSTVGVSGPRTQVLQVPASRWLDVRIVIPQEFAYPGCNTRAGRLELLREGAVVARGPFDYKQPLPGTNTHRVRTGPGMFALRYTLPGEVVWQSEPFRAADGVTVPLYRRGNAAQKLWTGTLRDAAGAAVPDRRIQLGDEMAVTMARSCPIGTDSDGRFVLPLCKGCLYSFQGGGGDAGERRTIRIDETVTTSRVQDVQLGAPLTFAEMAPTGTSRIFGSPEAPMKLVFLAEGYVAERETFTDSNGNGIWDGVQWADVDGDGLYDAGEPAAVYGDAEVPANGTDPRLGNEVIQDLNGDGVLSLDDRSLFERNVREYLRGLFSSDRYRNWRGAYQASAAMVYSPQAGMDHGAHVRDTQFDVSIDPERGVISIDYDEALLAASAASPDHDIVVVMINQPVPYGRVNSFILASGGIFGNSVNDDVAAHEFGHHVAGLADEYEEYSEPWLGRDPGAANATRFVLRDHVRWSAHVPDALDGRPTKAWTDGTGFFEGAAYHSSGAFRPSQASLMRFRDSLLFNVPSREAVDAAHAAKVRDWPGRLEVDGEGAGCDAFVARWDVAGLGVQAVDLRRERLDGDRVGSGGAAGSANIRAGARDLYLLDADTGVVLDVEAYPAVGCTGSSTGPVSTTVTAPAPGPGTAPPRSRDRTPPVDDASPGRTTREK